MQLISNTLRCCNYKVDKEKHRHQVCEDFKLSRGDLWNNGNVIETKYNWLQMCLYCQSCLVWNKNFKEAIVLTHCEKGKHLLHVIIITHFIYHSEWLDIELPRSCIYRT